MILRGICCLVGALMVGESMAAAANPNPAARVHARIIGGKQMKFTSKLKKVIELNFTLNFNHSEGKPIIDQYLGRVATNYALAGKDSAFSIKKFIGPGNGTSGGLPTTVPTLADLLSGEVIVDNNISNMNDIPSKSAAFATAFETAVKTNGRSILGFHGSGDGGTGWAFYTNELHPVDYHAHGNRTPAPVYINDAEAKHIVNEGLLATGTQKAVPMGTEGGLATGAVITKTVTTRQMTNEWYKFGRPLLTDPKTKDLATCFMRYDPATTDLETQYRYPGGNPFVWQIKIGAGKAMYLPPGHAPDELTTGTSFDGGSGDLEKFYAQALFYLAGYDTTACGADCAGLPIVDDNNRLTGEKIGTVGIVWDKGNKMSFVSGSGKPYTAKLLDVGGKVVAEKSGIGTDKIEFNESRLRPGVYVLSVKVGNQAPATRRYMVSPNPR